MQKTCIVDFARYCKVENDQAQPNCGADEAKDTTRTSHQRVGGQLPKVAHRVIELCIAKKIARRKHRGKKRHEDHPQPKYRTKNQA